MQFPSSMSRTSSYPSCQAFDANSNCTPIPSLVNLLPFVLVVCQRNQADVGRCEERKRKGGLYCTRFRSSQDEPVCLIIHVTPARR